ncbi:MAG: dihydropteroate synthase, partial [Candidatus Omnitrophica bacterium CG12_big_fil_rev_8_21_14_0_65_42_8]
IAIKNGADIVRVHDVKEIREAVVVSDAITRSGEK